MLPVKFQHLPLNFTKNNLSQEFDYISVCIISANQYVFIYIFFAIEPWHRWEIWLPFKAFGCHGPSLPRFLTQLHVCSPPLLIFLRDPNPTTLIWVRSVIERLRRSHSKLITHIADQLPFYQHVAHNADSRGTATRYRYFIRLRNYAFHARASNRCAVA